MRHVAEPDIAHAERLDDEEATEPQTVAIERHRLMEIVDVQMDVSNSRPRRHCHVERGAAAQLAEEVIHVDGLAPGVRLAIGGRRVGSPASGSPRVPRHGVSKVISMPLPSKSQR